MRLKAEKHNVPNKCRHTLLSQQLNRAEGIMHGSWSLCPECTRLCIWGFDVHLCLQMKFYPCYQIFKYMYVNANASVSSLLYTHISISMSRIFIYQIYVSTSVLNMTATTIYHLEWWRVYGGFCLIITSREDIKTVMRYVSEYMSS